MSVLLSTGKTVSYTTAYYNSTDVYFLVNGVSTWDNWKVGWYQTAWWVELDLGQNYDLDYCRFAWTQWIAAGVLCPTSMTIQTATATSSYTTRHVMTVFNTTDVLYATVWSSSAPLSANARYVRLSHPSAGAGKINTLMEIEVYGTAGVVPTTESVNYLKGRRNRWDYSLVSAG